MGQFFRISIIVALCCMVSASHLPYHRINFYPEETVPAVQHKYDQLVARWLDGALRYSLPPSIYSVIDRLLNTLLKPQQSLQHLASYLPESSPLHSVIALLISGSLLLNTTGAFVLRTLFIFIRRRDYARD